MNDDVTTFDLEIELTELLSELTRVQGELLEVLGRKRELLSTGDTTKMARLYPTEQALNDRLQVCADRCRELRRDAAMAGLNVGTLSELVSGLPEVSDQPWDSQIQQASARMRLLQHQSLTNWVLAQQSLLHVSQVLEIIATGRGLQPAYGKGESVHARGSLVDRAG